MRRAGVEKLGYFPIPEPMIRWLVGQFHALESGATVSIVDPCMGEGAALKVLADALREQGAKVLPFGCEISRARYNTAVSGLLNEKREGISRLLHGPAEFIETSGGAFSLLYLNPPFDEHGREQNRWLDLTREWLIPGGWLAFITTEESALRADTQELLNRLYENVTCYRYPEAQRHFNEVVVFGRRRTLEQSYGMRRAVLYSASTLTTLTLEEQFGFALPTGEPPKRFGMVVPEVEEGLNALRSSGISTGETWKRATQTASLQSRWQPLLELSDGHIANLISSGVFDGLAIHDAELGRCLITGYSSKARSKPVVEVSENGETQTTTVSEIPVVNLVVMNIDTGEVHPFSSRDPQHMERFILRHIETLKRAITDTLKPVFDVETMLADYLPHVAQFKAPGVLPGATRLRLNDGAKARVTHKLESGYRAVNEQNDQIEIAKSDVAHIYQNMLPAQVIKASAMAYALKHKTTSVIEIGGMGTGKTSTSMLTLYLYLAKWIEQAAQHDDKQAKIVVVCPGHLVNKWAREIATNFSEIEMAGRRVQVVIPGRVSRRKTAYKLIGEQVICEACGAAADVKRSKDEKLKGVSFADKLDRMKRLVCSNPKCGCALIEAVDDCPVADIDDAFAAPGMGVLILSKEDAKLGASWEPAFIRRTVHEREKATGKLTEQERIQCPHCGGYVQNKWGDYLHPDEAHGKRLFCKNTVEHAKRENGKVVMQRQTIYEWRGTQYSATHLPEGVERRHLVAVEREVPVMEKVRCGKPLFTFTRLGNSAKKSKTVPKSRNSFGAWASGTTHTNHGSARWELAKVIARRHRGEYLLVIDEAHQYKAADSTQGKAIQWLITSAQRTIALTGTPFGGKASSLFYLLHRLSPQFREAFSWRSVEYFIDQFGVRDYITKVSNSANDGTPTTYGAHVKETTRIEEGNGVDPSIVRWLLSIGVFLTLDDLGIALPPKEERFHWIAPEPELAAGLFSLECVRKEASLLAAKGDMSMFAAWMQAALGWPLCPDKPELYLHPDHRKIIEKLREQGKVEDADAYEKAHTNVWAAAVPFTDERPEGAITRQIADACARDWREHGDRSVVYVSGVKRPANKHLYQALKQRGLKAFILSTPGDMEVIKWCDPADLARCDLENRETVIADALAEKDIQVLIVNPSLVATGLDLIAFNRLHFCGLPTYSVYTFEQAMCRLHRPGQQKAVTIDFWVYGADPTVSRSADNQLQALGMAVMSDKVRASAVVSGSVGAGLAALNQQSSDIMSTLRDLLLNENTDAQPALEANTDATAKAPHTVDPRYAWIEAAIEAHDDARKLHASPTPALLPAPTAQTTIEVLPIWAAAHVEPEAEAQVATAAERRAESVSVEAKAETTLDVLRTLAAELNGTLKLADPLPLYAPKVAQQKPKPSPKRRMKIRLTDAPMDSPIWVISAPCPEPEPKKAAAIAVASTGLQLLLF